MENCLVKKFKGVVNNDKLQVLDCVTIRDITPGDNAQNRALFRMCMKEGEIATLKVINGVFIQAGTYEVIGDTFTVSGNNIDDMSYVNILPSNGCKVYINNKYNIKGLFFNAATVSINNMKVNGEDLSFLPELKVLKFSDNDPNTVCLVLEGTLSSAEDTDLKEFLLSKNNTTGNLAEIIPVKDSIEHIFCNDCPNIKVSLNYFADAPKLNYIRIYGSMENNIWASSTLRKTGPILCGSFSFNDSASVDNFLINMAALDFLSPGNLIKNIGIFGAGRTSASDTAVATIKAKTDINNVQFGNIYINGVEQ